MESYDKLQAKKIENINLEIEEVLCIVEESRGKFRNLTYSPTQS